MLRGSSFSILTFLKLFLPRSTGVVLPSKTKLNVIYNSKLVGAIITKTINDITMESNAFIVDHPLAYQSDIEIYKETT